MTLNETCIAIESEIGSILEKSNETLSELYVIESSINFGVFESSGGKFDKFKTAFKEKVKWLGKRISEVFEAVGKFLMKIINKISGRDRLAYYKNAITAQANFIKSAVNFVASTNANESLFVAFEAKFMDESKMTDDQKKMLDSMNKGRDKLNAYKENVKSAEEKYERMKLAVGEKVQRIIDTWGMPDINISSLIPPQGVKPNMSIADASSTLKKAFNEVKKATISNFNKLKSEATKSEDKDKISSAKKTFRECVKCLEITSLITTFLNKTKIA